MSYLIAAAGLDTVDGAPLPGTLLAGMATFDVGPEGLAALPSLRRWIREHGGSVQSDSGAPRPVETVEASSLYLVSLGAKPVGASFTNWSRASGPCPECGLLLARVVGEDPASSEAHVPVRRVVHTTRAAWLAAPDLLERLRRDGLDDGLVSLRVLLRGGEGLGVWPDRLLASAEPVSSASDDDRPRRCGTCLRLLSTAPDPAPVEWHPLYATALFVEMPAAPESTRGWWWYARLGQHLPVVSGEVVEVLRGVVADVSAFPVVTDESEAFLAKEYRGE